MGRTTGSAVSLEELVDLVEICSKSPHEHLRDRHDSISIIHFILLVEPHLLLFFQGARLPSEASVVVPQYRGHTAGMCSVYTCLFHTNIIGGNSLKHIPLSLRVSIEQRQHKYVHSSYVFLGTKETFLSNTHSTTQVFSLATINTPLTFSQVLYTRAICYTPIVMIS